VRAARTQFAPQAYSAAQRSAPASQPVRTAPAVPAAPAVHYARPLAVPAVPKTVAISPRKPYTVQAVVYRNQSRAQSEVAQLTQKGYAARMVVQGSLYVVCVGEYSSRYEAQKDLRALKRIYPDSYLRSF
jgi:cell division protein FtsN